MAQITAKSPLEHLDQAIAAHSRWKHRLRDMVEGGKLDIDAATATRDDACELGKWLKAYYPGEAEKKVFNSVRAKHRDFHVAVGKVVELVNANQNAEAEREIGLSSNYTKTSVALTVEIMQWKKLLC
jgi:hypothetical protein